MEHKQFRNIIITASFIAIISFPILNGKLNLIKDIENTENRKPKSRPEFNINKLDAYPAQFDNYYTDNFNERQRLIKYYNQLNLVVFKKSPMPDKVIMGNNGWLFMAGNEADSYRGMNRFSEIELEQFRLELEYRKNYLEQRGYKFYFLIAPVKANIYPEEMPKSSFQFNSQSWGEQLIEYLNKNSTVKPIDVYSIFKQSKQNGLLYLKLDNHWNQRGAFIAATEVLKCIKSDIPTLKIPSITNMFVIDSIAHKGNIAGMLSNTELFTDSVFELTPKNGFQSVEAKKVGYPCVQGFPYPWEYELVRMIPNSDEPKILIISDSFGSNIYPFLSESFSRSVKIFDSWQYKLNEDIVDAEKPNVVLLIALESNMRNILRYQSRLKTGSIQ